MKEHLEVSRKNNNKVSDNGKMCREDSKMWRTKFFFGNNVNKAFNQLKNMDLLLKCKFPRNPVTSVQGRDIKWKIDDKAMK